MANVAESIAAGGSLLAAAGIVESHREAASLLQLALDRNRTFLIAHPEYELKNDEVGLFNDFVERRSNREPFHHITGVKEFYGLDFLVSKDVLIPRPETEMLVEQCIGLLQKTQNPHFCEIGVGSGCIAVSMLHALAGTSAVGLEISERAMAVASKNAQMHAVSERFELRQSDLFSALTSEKFDLIVSNPPYIPIDDLRELEPEVRDFEPRIALSDGGNGISLIEKIVKQSPNFLKPGGFLVVEFGIGQVAAVKCLFSEDRWESVDIAEDFQRIPRMVCARTVAY